MGGKRIDALREKWLELHESGRKEEADKLYWDELFPLIRGEFRRKCTEFKNRYDALIMTVGTTPQPLILTLDAVRPSRVFFIYTADTEAHLSRVIQEVDFLRRHEVHYDREKVNPDDPVDIYEKIGRRWEEWSREGEMRCALDNTGGKKSMVSAAAAAANFLGIDILYVDHEKYLAELRTPMPGTEYLTQLPNPYITLGELKIRQCLDLFNAGSFEAAAEKLREVRGEIQGKRALSVATRVETLERIVRGYSLWDRFHFRRACEELRKARESAKRFELEVDLDGLDSNLMVLETLSREARGESLFKVLRRSPEFGLHLAVDLYCNAARRELAGAPDDAVVRIYRCLELVSQLRLAQIESEGVEGFDTDNLRWELVPEAVKARYEHFARQVYGNDYVRMPRDLGMMHGHILLAAFDDPLWRREGVDGLKRFHKTVDKRNELILIHGNKRATDGNVEEFTQQAYLVLGRLANIMGEDLDDLVDRHNFIRL
ncbi:MAG: TIGR02710 family CRISPR-associated protein [Actinobacteria bacterium]|nr:TIGR02710 family CRISPR-associated protein [Actinomycetota bacterium]